MPAHLGPPRISAQKGQNPSLDSAPNSSELLPSYAQVPCVFPPARRAESLETTAQHSRQRLLHLSYPTQASAAPQRHVITCANIRCTRSLRISSSAGIPKRRHRRFRFMRALLGTLARAGPRFPDRITRCTTPAGFRNASSAMGPDAGRSGMDSQRRQDPISRCSLGFPLGLKHADKNHLKSYDSILSNISCLKRNNFTRLFAAGDLA